MCNAIFFSLPVWYPFLLFVIINLIFIFQIFCSSYSSLFLYFYSFFLSYLNISNLLLSIFYCLSFLIIFLSDILFFFFISFHQILLVMGNRLRSYVPCPWINILCSIALLLNYVQNLKLNYVQYQVIVTLIILLYYHVVIFYSYLKGTHVWYQKVIMFFNL